MQGVRQDAWAAGTSSVHSRLHRNQTLSRCMPGIQQQIVAAEQRRRPARLRSQQCTDPSHQEYLDWMSSLLWQHRLHEPRCTWFGTHSLVLILTSRLRDCSLLVGLPAFFQLCVPCSECFTTCNSRLMEDRQVCWPAIHSPCSHVLGLALPTSAKHTPSVVDACCCATAEQEPSRYTL